MFIMFSRMSLRLTTPYSFRSFHTKPQHIYYTQYYCIQTIRGISKGSGCIIIIFFCIIYISSSIYSLLHDIKRQIRLFTSNVTQTPKGFQKVFIYIIHNIDIRKVLKGSYVCLCTSSSMSSRMQTSKEFQEAIMYVYIRRT